MLLATVTSGVALSMRDSLRTAADDAATRRSTYSNWATTKPVRPRTIVVLVTLEPEEQTVDSYATEDGTTASI